MGESVYATSGSFRVRPHRPARTIALGFALVVLAIGGSWGAYELGRHQGGAEANLSRATEARLRIQIDDLRERVGELTDRIALLERSSSIDEGSFERLQEQLERREQQIGELEEELAFYRSLVSPSEGEQGIEIDRVSLYSEGDGRYRYEVVLTRIDDDDTRARGDVDLSVSGTRDGEDRRLEFDELRTGEDSASAFEFSYFQALTGRLRLPDDFTPESARLIVTPDGDDSEPIEEEFDWDSLVSGGS